MFSKIWSTISDWMGVKNHKPLPRVKKPIHKERFLIIDDPFQKKVAQKQTFKSKAKAPQQILKQIPQNAQQLMNYYKLSIIESQNIELEEEKKIDDEFIFDLSKINDALKEIENKYESIAIDSHQISHSIETVLGGIQKANKSEYQQGYIYKKYIRYVQDVLQMKYTGERIDYPKIQYQNFRQIIEIWDRNDDQSLVPGYDHLRYNHLRLLGPSRWLNDQVISEYIGHMNSKLGQKPNNNYVIFNSLKVTSLFDKSDYKKLQKVLQRQKVTKTSILILAIHKVNHWIFLKMQNSLISIYDSLPMQNIQNYISFSLINKIIKFAQYYYGTPPDIQRVTSFPIQKNGNDCGMMMLCGMKDIIREYKNWSFTQSDLWYKRVLVTKELLEKKLTGF